MHKTPQIAGGGGNAGDWARSGWYGHRWKEKTDLMISEAVKVGIVELITSQKIS
jgi:hypothetical protein